MFAVALLTSALLALADARIYERCELARDLLSLGIKKEHLATWVCIAFHESRFDTAARNPSSGDHGLLQISELYWCGAGKACGLPCSALRDEDISDDVECALRIHEEHTRLQGNGFLAWVVYPHHCKHNAKKYLADCETSVKTASVRTNSRARILKSQARNITSYANNPKIDELLPPYLAIGSVFRGKFEKEFEQNYNKKVKVNWLNYKIDNIDDLKLPDFNQKVIGEYITSTLVTTTSTSPSPLPKIKPPSPRRIESNSFRRKKTRPLPDPVKFSETTELPTITSTSSVTKVTPSNIDRSRIENSLQSPTTTISPVTTASSTIEPSIKNYEVYSNLNTITSAEAQKETTKFPALNSANQEHTTTFQEISTRNVDRSSATLSPMDQSSMNKSTSYSSIATTESTSVLTESLYYNSIVPISSSSSSSTTSSLATKSIFNFGRYTSKAPSTTSARQTTSSTKWRTILDNKLTTLSTTSKPLPTTWSWRTWKPWSSEVTKKTEGTTTGSKHRLSTTSPWRNTRAHTTPRSLATEVLDLKNNISSTTTVLVESTTLKPGTTTITVNSRSTVNPSIKNSKSTTKTVTSTETPWPSTVRTTQSIFDLYLNPTKRPKIPTFSFPPIKSRAFSLRIFEGGTTTHPPTLLKNDGTSELEEAKKNQIKRQAS